MSFWIKGKSTLSFFLTVEGVTTNVDMAETDGTYAQKGMCVFKLGTAPLNSTVIQYAIFDSASKSFSQIATDTFTGDGTNKEFALAQTPLNQKPLEHNVIVKVGNKVLNAGYNQQFKVTTGVREYQLRDYQSLAVRHSIDKKRCVLLSPTASGKSLIIYYLIRYYFPERSLIIVPTLSLVSQMYSDFEAYAKKDKNQYEI